MIEPKGIVVHSMSEYIAIKGERLYAKDFLAHPDIRLSVHAFINPDGSVTKMIATNKRASHAGKSSWNSLNGLNEHFLGVEVLVEGENNYSQFIKKIKDKKTFTDEQYIGLADLCAEWCKEFDISLDNVVRHSDVSGVTVRPNDPKLDPGEGFNWLKFRTMLSIRVLEN